MSRPNILVIMVDQLTGTLFPDGPVDFLHVPALSCLAERSLRFANCYTASPLCAPARASFMSGQMPFRTRVYDNAAEFSAAIPTWAHHLRRAGYATCLSGKMHFVGPDQLHGFEERLTTDVYPADFGWTPDWRRPTERIDWWYHNLGSVTEAGVAEITNQMEFDDEVAAKATAKLYGLARGHDPRPWALCVSFTHPHDPFVARRRFWDLQRGFPEAPQQGPIAFSDQDPHSQRLFFANDYRNFDITDDDVARSRRAYFANISYLDDKIGALLDVLADTRQEAAVVFVSDHGEMLGERGLWFKMSFREGSARVPLMISAPGVEPGLVEAPVSTVDLCPTLAALGGADLADVMPWTDGSDLLDGRPTGPATMEYAAEGSVAPMVALMEESFKYVVSPADPEQLFNLSDDPGEARNLANDPSHQARMSRFRDAVARRWDLDRVDAEVRESQAMRRAVYGALRQGGYYPWDWQPLRDASERYMRNHMDLNVLEDRQRFPRGE